MDAGAVAHGASTGSPRPANDLPIGGRVRLQGLNAVRLNGSYGMVVGPLVAGT